MTEAVKTSTPLTVMVVDDTATNRQILQVFLKKLGFQVISAEDGVQAVGRFKNDQPDLILMDVMMPVMDGYEATRQIKKLSTRWTPVVFLSALDKEENLVAGLDAGGDDYLAKPVNFVILDAKLRSLVRSLDLQRQLDEQGRRIKAITDNIVDGVVTIDERGTIRWHNSALEKIFGYQSAEMEGQNITLLMPEPYRSEHDNYLGHYVAGGQPRIISQGQRLVQGKRKNGEIFPLELGVNEMQVDGIRQFVGVIRDVSERIKVENALKETTDRLQEYHDVQQAENQLAADIVKRQMLRKELADPHVRHWVVPAANFSGDIVAATRRPDGSLCVILADATGHGLGAAICTLPVLSVFYSLVESGAEMPVIITEINRQLKATMPVGRFVAATVLCIRHAAKEADVWIGGTPDLLQIDASGKLKRQIVAEHLPLGIDDMSVTEAQPVAVPIETGDQFVMFSDGLLEAENYDKLAFGFEKMCGALASAPAAKRLDAVQDALTRHMGSATPHDDVSLLLIDCG